MGWYLEALVNYANFSGRATCAEYWWFTLVNAFIPIALMIVMGPTPAAGALLLVYLAAVIIPSLSVSVRRLHDTDRSGWWLLLGLIPFGSLVLVFFYLLGGTRGPNKYGPDPRVHMPVSPQKVATRNSMVEDEIMQLYELYKSGAIPSEEYHARKQALFTRR